MVDASAECERCGRTFPPDTPHTEVNWSRYPPESRKDELGRGGHLCPDCSRDFRDWLDEDPRREAVVADGGDPLANAESHGGYLGFEVPEDYDA